eukprot:c20991_g2_i1 orf=267-548(-)
MDPYLVTSAPAKKMMIFPWLVDAPACFLGVTSFCSELVAPIELVAFYFQLVWLEKTWRSVCLQVLSLVYLAHYLCEETFLALSWILLWCQIIL